MAERCDLTELEPAACAHCRGLPDPGREPVEVEVAGPPVEARWPGVCIRCGDRFPEGAQIRADGGGGWIANCCERGDVIDHE